MGSFTSDFIVIICLSGVLNVLLAVLAYYRRNHFPGTKAFIIIAAASSVYIFGYALELSSGSLREIAFWSKVEYLGMPFIAPAELVLVLYFVGLDKLLNRTNRFILFAVPFITTLLAVTNDYHHWFYRDLHLRPGTPSPIAEITMGPWYIVHGSFTCGCLLASGCIMLGKWKTIRHNYQWQMMTLLIGIFLPALGSFLYLLGLTPYGIDPVPILMSVTSTMYLWAIWTRGMLTVAPLARESLFEHMRDGVLVMDLSGRIVDFNPAASKMIGFLNAAAIGKPLDELFEAAGGEAVRYWAEKDPFIGSEQRLRWFD
ncbi:histidine kinase N-terminal 7TM domain-containing protein [Paenibacillus caui]|uniref:histidine kinase N-terminal 7TM domain-containing protein n=1 Tax=Paenibacillus caui TaxID=2873927 RepID=UPI001CA90BD1|nr:histidine kinase N-terminal 7TM domain-containing protein [Paenibacillus caui]